MVVAGGGIAGSSKPVYSVNIPNAALLLVAVPLKLCVDWPIVKLPVYTDAPLSKACNCAVV
jgi:hypothetical protein